VIRSIGGVLGVAVAAWVVGCGPSAVARAAGPDQLGAWRAVPVEGATCGRGAPYRYYLSPGARPDAGLLLVLSGGGVCLKDGLPPAGATGAAEQLHCMRYANFTDPFMTDATVLSGALGFLIPYLSRGAANAFREYTYVVLPYCTGDLHSGRRVEPYDYDPDPTATFDVVHRGALNVMAVLDDVRRQYPAEQPVLATGLSAGGFGLILDYPELLRRWPQAVILPDAGIAPDHPLSLMVREHERVAARWGATAGLPDYCPTASCLADTQGLLAAHAAHYDGDPAPWHPFGYLQAQRDATLTSYLELSACGYQLGLRRGYEATRSAGNLRAWLPDSANHVFSAGQGPAAVGGVTWQAFLQQLALARAEAELPADAVDPWAPCNPLALPLLWH
jgi:hypothetical protein